MAEFPKEFVWGAATAAYQIEGGATEGGKGLSIWDVFSHTPGCTYRGETGDVACDSYHRWKEDLALLQSMHLKAYRFSVAWTRIAPNGGTDWNEEGFAYYDTLVDALLEAGIEPYVTLYHWDLPQALEEKGGWRSEETARAFASYAAKMAEHFKGRVHQWFTFNEPACIVKMGYGTGEHAPGLKLPLEGQFTCWRNVIYAHCLAAHRADGHGAQGDQEGGARPLQHPAEDVPAEAVGPQPMGQGGALQLGPRQQGVRVVGRPHQADQDQRRHEAGDNQPGQQVSVHPPLHDAPPSRRRGSIRWLTMSATVPASTTQKARITTMACTTG